MINREELINLAFPIHRKSQNKKKELLEESFKVKKKFKRLVFLFQEATSLYRKESVLTAIMIFSAALAISLLIPAEAVSFKILLCFCPVSFVIVWIWLKDIRFTGEGIKRGSFTGYALPVGHIELMAMRIVLTFCAVLFAGSVFSVFYMLTYGDWIVFYFYFANLIQILLVVMSVYMPFGCWYQKEPPSDLARTLAAVKTWCILMFGYILLMMGFYSEGVRWDRLLACGLKKLFWVLLRLPQNGISLSEKLDIILDRMETLPYSWHWEVIAWLVSILLFIYAVRKVGRHSRNKSHPDYNLFNEVGGNFGKMESKRG
jgi:hypothetical protein